MADSHQCVSYATSLSHYSDSPLWVKEKTESGCTRGTSSSNGGRVHQVYYKYSIKTAHPLRTTKTSVLSGPPYPPNGNLLKSYSNK